VHREVATTSVMEESKDTQEKNSEHEGFFVEKTHRDNSGNPIHCSAENQAQPVGGSASGDHLREGKVLI